MTPEIPAEAERAKLLLSYPEYRRWWITNVNKLPLSLPTPEPAVHDGVDLELG